jgi:AmiR/NasT family two-component response regulator
MNLPLKTVVIADDEESMRILLSALLRELGYTCIGMAANGSEAVNLVRTLHPNLIVIDFHMPVLDGLEATRQIAPLGTTAVVMMTADGALEVGRQALDAGASGYMLKPFDSQQLSAILETAWHRFQTIFTLEEKARELDAALEMRKLLEKAKGVLMEQQGFSESEAHHTLLKMSQDQGIPLKDVCRAILQVRMVLGKKKKIA